MTLANIVIAGLIVLFASCVLVAIASIPLAVIVGRAINTSNHALAQQAADHGEPSRADIEWDMWVEEALQLSETPIHDDLAAEKLRAELNNDAAVVLWLRGAR